MRINDFIRAHKYIFLFGAGGCSLPLKKHLTEQGIPIHGFVVSHKHDNALDGTPVYEIDEINYPPNECGIIFALMSKYHNDVVDLLKKHDLTHYFRYDDEILRGYNLKYNELTAKKLNQYSEYFPNHCSSPSSWRRVLIIRLDGIGDAVLTTPAIREIRRNHPESHITLLVSEFSYNLFEKCPYADRVLSVPADKLNVRNINGRLKNALDFVRTNLGGREFDVSLVPRWDIDDYGASFISFFSHAAYSVAYSENVTESKMIANKNYDRLFSYTIHDSSMIHEAERNLRFLKEIGCTVDDDSLELWADSEDDDAIKRILSDNDYDCDKEIISIGLAASSDRKKWDYKNYFRLIEKITAEYPCRYYFVLLGGFYIPFEENGQDSRNIINLTGQLTLRQSFSLFERSAMYIGNDTGLMHIAAAAKNLILEISAFPKNGDISYGNSTFRFHPWKVKYYIAQPMTGKDDCSGWCRKEYAHCINEVTVNNVFKGFQYLISDDSVV